MLSIIINHYRTPELLKLCLKSIETHLGALEHEVIVRDGEAMEETAEMMREDFPNVIYLPEKRNIGFAHLVNAGIGRARGNCFLIINADIIIPSAEAMEMLMQYLADHPKCGMLGPKLLNLNGTLQPSCFRFYKPLTLLYRRTVLGRTRRGKSDIARFMYADKLQVTSYELRDPFPVDWLMGSALLVRKEALDDVGLFDTRFFMYFEDVDWCRRFWEQGWEVIWHPGAIFYHYHGQASKGKKGLIDIIFNRYTRIHITSALKYFWKYGLRVPRYGV
ncbi:MAG: glycosyltransferase family 2 protein [bacterium]|nr:glycosyltransferase family 2 protein [bacterium]